MSIEQENARVLCVSSGKGGVGKTHISVNLAYMMAKMGQRVLLIDGDLELANVDILLNIEPKCTIAEVLEDKAPPVEAVVEVEPNFSVLPASSGAAELAAIGPDEQALLGAVLQEMRQSFDVVLIDTGAGIGPVVQWFNSLADHNLVVLTSEPTAITDAYALMKVLNNEMGLTVFHLIVNNVACPGEGEKIVEGIRGVTDRFLGFRPHFLGSIPKDDVALQALRDRVPEVKRFPESALAIAVAELSKKAVALGAPTGVGSTS